MSKSCLFFKIAGAKGPIAPVLNTPLKSLCWRDIRMVSYPKDIIISSIKVAFFIFTKRCNARKKYDFKILFLNVGSSFNELFLRIFFLPEAILYHLVYFFLLFLTIYLTRFWLDSLYLPNWVLSCQKIVK